MSDAAIATGNQMENQKDTFLMDSGYIDDRIGAGDIAGFNIELKEHEYGLSHGRASIYIALPQDLLDEIDADWKESTENEFSADKESPKYLQFAKDVKKRLEAHGLVVSSHGMNPVIEKRATIIMNSERARYDDRPTSDGRLMEVGCRIGDAGLAKTDEDAGWKAVGLIKFILDDDGKLPHQDLAEQTRQAYYRGVLGKNPEAVPALDYKSGPEDDPKADTKRKFY